MTGQIAWLVGLPIVLLIGWLFLRARRDRPRGSGAPNPDPADEPATEWWDAGEGPIELPDDVEVINLRVEYDPDDEVRNDWLQTFNSGDVRMSLGHFPEALEAFEEALAKAEARMAAEPTAQGRRDLWNTLDAIGNVLVRLDRPDEAMRRFEEALPFARQLADEFPSDPDVWRPLQINYNDIGDLLMQQGKPTEALKQYEAGLAIARDLAARNPGDSGLERALALGIDRTATVLLETEHNDQALARFRQSLAVTSTLAERDPDNADYQRDLALMLERIAIVLRRQGQHDDEREHLRRALDIRRTLAGNPLADDGLREQLAFNCVTVATHDEAEAPALMEEARGILEQLEAGNRLTDAGAELLSYFRAARDRPNPSGSDTA